MIYRLSIGPSISEQKSNDDFSWEHVQLPREWNGEAFISKVDICKGAFDNHYLCGQQLWTLIRGGFSRVFTSLNTLRERNPHSLDRKQRELLATVDFLFVIQYAPVLQENDTEKDSLDSYMQTF